MLFRKSDFLCVAIVMFLTRVYIAAQFSSICSNQYFSIPWLCNEPPLRLSRLILDETEINSAILNIIREVVTYTLHTSLNSPGIEFNSRTYQSINLDSSIQTKFLIHGWSNDKNSRMPQTLKDTYLSSQRVNVVIIDWSRLSNLILYPLPANGTFYIGECVSEMIALLFPRNSNLNVHLIGHSLGAHVAGFAGRSLPRKGFNVPRITGLDPASPLIRNGLALTDASFVDVIHTAAGTLAQRGPLGHVDFYPNGGTSPQPGCISDPINIIFCSHARSWQFFARSIQEPMKYPAYPCGSFEDFLINRCNGDVVYMGEYTPSRSRGVYYLNAMLR